ncbi:PIH1 domain-containing protein 2 [Austrofundulus limnaeus]|uniref:PIH1 domain-containing protein 2 n=1 Tax=Austrofundulus limnaeus TaxID=52670 RepID=A0A2I4BJJ0_AUSLI|nr:PREDICTED: PIH1 domain-containing protein 2 [Austrofundulus limnaeus]XP_013867919.1 PREDICTED: PIH1 domain-containing protein 2 [Austrofundulus limnaeus]
MNDKNDMSSTEVDVLRQVNQFWSMLDELSLNDPTGYRKFIEIQMKKGAEFNAPPELHSCVRTEMLEPKPGLLYINIFGWKRVPAPQTLRSPLPMCGGKLEQEIIGGQGWCAVLDVALNPAVLQESKDKVDITNIYKLALSFAQQQHGMQLSPEYSVVNFSPKSSPDDLYRRLGFQTQHPFKQPKPACQTPASLISILSNPSDKLDDDSAPQISCRPTENKKDLIQVISTTSVEPQKPEYQLEVKTDTAGVPRSVELTVELPGVRSVSECRLQVSEKDVLLEVEDVYYLLLELPTTVNEETASAIFNKKKHRLTLMVDVL